MLRQWKCINLQQNMQSIKPYPLCLGNISKDFTPNNLKKTGLKGIGKNFSVDYNPICISDILDIYRYLMNET